MSTIANDSRHTDVTILDAGRIGTRRYATWPMHLGDACLNAAFAVPSVGSADGSPCHPGIAEIAFDDLADTHRPQEATTVPSGLCDSHFLSELIAPIGGRLPDFPARASSDLRIRAALVDEACERLAEGWHDGTWGAFDISIGLARLNCLWQRSGRVPDPGRANNKISVVVPPASGEIIGAIVKSDLFHAAGISVRLVMEPDEASVLKALDRDGLSPILVAGPRVGLDGDRARAESLADRLQSRFPRRAIYLGGRTAGPLAEWPERLALRSKTTSPFRARDIDWLALAAMRSVAEQHGVRWRS